MLALPIILVRLPADYFLTLQSHTWFSTRHPFLRVAGYLLRNLVGGVVVLAGLAMLLLPGQGLLTIVLGLTLLDIPGKRRLLLALVRRPTILTVINALRARYGQPPLRMTPE